MENKKQLISLIIIGLSGLFLVLSVLFLPIAEVVSKDMVSGDIIPEASGVFNLITFSQAMLNISNACYNASGPAWLSVFGVALNWVLIILTILLIGFVVFELCTTKNSNLILKQNAVTKKLGLVVGYFAFVVCFFEIGSFLISTALAEGYFVYTPKLSMFLSVAFSIAILVCSYLLEKPNTQNQVPNKIRDSLGFSLTFLSVILFVMFVFIPQTIDGQSLFGISMLANDILKPVGGHVFVGLSQWVTFFMAIFVIVLLVKCLKGLNLISKNNTAKTVKSLKRWTVIWAIWTLVYLFLMTASVVVVYGTFVFDGDLVISPITILMVILSLVPCLLSSTIASTKKEEKTLLHQ